MATKAKRLKKVSDFYELKQLCEAGDERYQQLCIAALRNLGSENLASKREPAWLAAYDGLNALVGVMAGEYGQSEDEAFKGVLDEINFVR